MKEDLYCIFILAIVAISISFSTIKCNKQNHEVEILKIQKGWVPCVASGRYDLNPPERCK